MRITVRVPLAPHMSRWSLQEGRFVREGSLEWGVRRARSVEECSFCFDTTTAFEVLDARDEEGRAIFPCCLNCLEHQIGFTRRKLVEGLLNGEGALEAPDGVEREDAH